MHKIEAKRYLIVFLITALIFVFVFWLSSIFSNQKLSQLREIQEQIAIDILSTETRYSLLEQTSCDHVLSGIDVEETLSSELNDLAKRLKHMESQLGEDDEDVLFVKKYYSILQIKDYLLMQELTDKCGEELFTILYFHETDCKECTKQSLVLDEIIEDYPTTRVYWLDKDLNTPSMRTMVSLFNITVGPTLVIDGETYEGFQSLDSLKEIAPEAFPEIEEESEEDEETAE